MSRLGFVLLSLLSGLSFQAAALSPREIDSVPLHLLDPAAVERARAALPPATGRGPLRLALEVPMSLGLDDGAWSEDGEISIWRARVHSVGASLLIAHFDRFALPAGAELRISDPAGTLVQGPYTAGHGGSADGLWTAMVPGQEALLELRLPTAARSDADLHLGTLGHGIYAMRAADEVTPKSGSCNIDVTCSAGADWGNEIRSTVLIQTGSTACSGLMVNNTRQDDRPFLLTATHCGITVGNAAGVTVYFNYQTSSCGGTPNGSLAQNQTGATFRFGHSRSDHTLLELNSRPSSAFNVFLSGFDASNTVPSSGRGIHHPNGDEKRISVYDRAGAQRTVNLSGVTPVDAIEITWAQGVTEGGSSGSGLWNQSKRAVGVLSGGDSKCGEPAALLRPAVPSSPGPDYYGRMDVAWDAGLSTHLNPGGVGGRSVGGKNLGAAANPSSGRGVGSGGGGGGGGGGAFGAALLLALIGLGRLPLRVSAGR